MLYGIAASSSSGAAGNPPCLSTGPQATCLFASLIFVACSKLLSAASSQPACQPCCHTLSFQVNCLLVPQARRKVALLKLWRGACGKSVNNRSIFVVAFSLNRLYCSWNNMRRPWIYLKWLYKFLCNARFILIDSTHAYV